MIFQLILFIFEYFSKNKFLLVQIHPTHLMFDVFSELVVKINQNQDFEHFLKKVKFFFILYQKLTSLKTNANTDKTKDLL